MHVATTTVKNYPFPNAIYFVHTGVWIIFEVQNNKLSLNDIILHSDLITHGGTRMWYTCYKHLHACCRNMNVIIICSTCQDNMLITVEAKYTL